MINETVDQWERIGRQLKRLLEETNQGNLDVLSIEKFNSELFELKEQVAVLARKTQDYLFKHGIDRRIDFSRRRIRDRRSYSQNNPPIPRGKGNDSKQV